tara:strand:+ start:3695 stop:5029 length:1335 start_codon:yes stop_codon:yes gene_type:complete
MDIDEAKCNFINTEINHDLGPGSKSQGKPGPVKVNEIHKKSIFIESSREDTRCPIPRPENWADWFNNDPQSFESVVRKKIGDEVFGQSPNVLYDNETTPVDETGIMDGEWYANTGVGAVEERQRKINVRKYHQKHGNFKDFSDKNLFHMFDDCIGNDMDQVVDVLFVIDTGDKLGHLLGKNPEDATQRVVAEGLQFTKYNINVIHSPVTLGDSAPKNKPHAPVYDKIFKQFSKHDGKPGRVSCNLLSWLVTKNIIINDGGDIPKEDFMTTHKIAANYLSVPGQTNGPYTYQTWKDETDTPIYSTTNPKVENNKTTVQDWLRSAGDGGANLNIIEQGRDSDINLQNKKLISLNVQKKRSGDHLQLLFAKHLYKFRNHLELMKPDDFSPRGNPFELKDPVFFEKNTFFITGDWPACAFAIFNKINTVMFYKQQDKEKTCFLVFTFS